MNLFKNAIILFILLFPVRLFSSELIPVDFKQMAADSELIFEGVVIDIQYKLSKPADDKKSPVPFTFVTFTINKVYKNTSYSKDKITLRFMGGYDDHKRQILMIDGIPLFNKGDNDILFVKGNGISICPLIGWQQGRYRIFDQKMYNDFGQEIFLNDQKKIAYGRNNPPEGFMMKKIKDKIIKQIQSEIKGESQEKPVEMQGKQFKRDEFSDYLSHYIKTALSDIHQANNIPVKSADINEEFIIRFNAKKPPVFSERTDNR